MSKSIEIVKILSDYLEENPSIRFGQALHNLSITMFNTSDPEDCGFLLKDIYNDTDEEILERIKIWKTV